MLVVTVYLIVSFTFIRGQDEQVEPEVGYFEILDTTTNQRISYSQFCLSLEESPCDIIGGKAELRVKEEGGWAGKALTEETLGALCGSVVALARLPSPEDCRRPLPPPPRPVEEGPPPPVDEAEEARASWNVLGGVEEEAPETPPTPAVAGAWSPWGIPANVQTAAPLLPGGGAQVIQLDCSISREDLKAFLEDWSAWGGLGLLPLPVRTDPPPPPPQSRERTRAPQSRLVDWSPWFQANLEREAGLRNREGRYYPEDLGGVTPGANDWREQLRPDSRQDSGEDRSDEDRGGKEPRTMGPERPRGRGAKEPKYIAKEPMVARPLNASQASTTLSPAEALQRRVCAAPCSFVGTKVTDEAQTVILNAANIGNLCGNPNLICTSNATMTTADLSTTSIPPTPMPPPTRLAQFVLDFHNRLRSATATKYTATNMRMMFWDGRLAAKAASHARKCVFAHSADSERCGVGGEGFHSLGENLALTLLRKGLGDMSVTELEEEAGKGLQGWLNEEPNFDPKTGQCKAGTVCGHFTQMIWADTDRLGCGVAECAGTSLPIPDWPSEQSRMVLVCLYGPGGNVEGERPLRAGGSADAVCSQCPSPGCSGPLCVGQVPMKACSDRADSLLCAKRKELGRCDSCKGYFVSMKMDCAKTCVLCNVR